MARDDLKNILNKRYYFELTKYPEIFRRTYWGGFSEEKDNWEIADNRNKFVEDYKITRYRDRTTPQYISAYFGRNSDLYDHQEVYESKDNYVLIVSTYIREEEDSSAFVELYKDGWEKIYKLYIETATTFVKVVPKEKE